MFAPDPRQHRRCQAGKPLIDLLEFPEPPLALGLRQLRIELLDGDGGM